MFYLLQLRLKQCYRALSDIGWLLLLLVSPMVVIFLLGLLERVQLTGTPVLAMVGLFLVFMTHARRQDQGFLRLLNYAPRQIFLVEYTAAVFPLSILALIALGDWLNPLLLHFGVLIIAFLPVGFSGFFSPKGGANLNWIPTRFFEFKCALRKDYFQVITLYIIGLLACLFTFSMPVVVLLLSIIAASAFDAIENKEMLELALVKKNWLLIKIVQQSKLFHIGMLPLYVLFLLLHTAYWYILLGVIVVGSGLLFFTISYKYAHYYPGRKKANNQLPMTLFLLFLINPFFAPGTLVYLWVYYRRANRNMSLYFK